MVSFCAIIVTLEKGVVFSIVGATGSTTLCYILPGIFYTKVHKTVHSTISVKRILAMALASWGLIVMVVALTFIILHQAHVINVPVSG